MDILGVSIERLNHASFKIKTEKKTVYIDPYEIKTHEGADFILITHEHFDHCSIQDIMKIVKGDTIVIAAEECKSKLERMRSKVSEIVYINPGGKIAIGKLQFQATHAYNTNKFKAPDQPFHPNRDKKCGYIITTSSDTNPINIYHAGDTDVIKEMKSLPPVNIALLPISGTYVMTPQEATEAVEIIKPEVAVPMHYGAIVGTQEDAERFHQLAHKKTKVIVL